MGKIDSEEYVESRVPFGSFDGKLPPAADLFPVLAESTPGAAGILGQVDYNSSGDGRVQPMPELVDAGYRWVLGKRSRSRSRVGLDDVVVTPGPEPKRQKGPAEDLTRAPTTSHRLS